METRNIIKCPNCGADTDKANTFCVICGSLLQKPDENQQQSAMTDDVFPNVHTQTTDSEYDYQQASIPSNTSADVSVQPPVKKGKSKKILSIILSVVLATSAGMAGKYFAQKMMKNSQENKEEKKIEAFIKSCEDYEKGYFDDYGYESEFWNISYTAGDGWIMMESSELEEISEASKQNAIAKARESLESVDISDKLKEKAISAIYANGEFGAYYIEDDIIAGELICLAFTAYGIEETDSYELANEIKSSLSSNADCRTVASKKIGGIEYAGICAEYPGDIMIETYLATKDNMVIMMMLSYVDDYKYPVVDVFDDMYNY